MSTKISRSPHFSFRTPFVLLPERHSAETTLFLILGAGATSA